MTEEYVENDLRCVGLGWWYKEWVGYKSGQPFQQLAGQSYFKAMGSGPNGLSNGIENNVKQLAIMRLEKHGFLHQTLRCTVQYIRNCPLWIDAFMLPTFNSNINAKAKTSDQRFSILHLSSAFSTLSPW